MRIAALALRHRRPGLLFTRTMNTGEHFIPLQTADAAETSGRKSFPYIHDPLPDLCAPSRTNSAAHGA